MSNTSENNDSVPNYKKENISSVQVNQETTSEPTTEIPTRKDLVLTYISINFLKEIAKWTNFISIVGFVLVGFIVFIGLAFGAIMSAITAMIPQDFPAGSPNPAAFGGAFGFLYIIMAAIYFFPVYYLFNFSTKLKKAIQLNSETILETSLKNLKSHYKFMGILLIILLVIYGGMFLVFGGIALMAGMM